MSKLDDLEAAIKRCDRLDWRIDYDEDAEVWYAWFHPDWEADPRRVIRVILADDEPSANEQACIEAMQLVMANAPAMVQELRAAQAELATLREAAQAAIAEADENHNDAIRDGETDAYCSLLPDLRAAIASDKP